ncbi:MAG: CRISPR-associated protein Cas4 [Ignavibacteriales bacterium]|nr:CRISPR-associated protein Cas4 [Ignavibacteriales bacterium]
MSSSTFTEDDFIQLSALQHYVFCPRQCGLIYVDDAWHDNVFTVRGEILHEKVDTDTYETRGTTKTVRGLRIHSFRLGIVGRADVVEFKDGKSGDEIMPVEFKAGEPKEDISDKVQLCAQALCLEEMMNTTIQRGAFFYGKVRRRTVVELNDVLRQQTEEIVIAVREIVSTQGVPVAEYSAKCRSCSLESLCLPKAMNQRKLTAYINQLYQP